MLLVGATGGMDLFNRMDAHFALCTCGSPDGGPFVVLRTSAATPNYPKGKAAAFKLGRATTATGR